MTKNKSDTIKLLKNYYQQSKPSPRLPDALVWKTKPKFIDLITKEKSNVPPWDNSLKTKKNYLSVFYTGISACAVLIVVFLIYDAPAELPKMVNYTHVKIADRSVSNGVMLINVSDKKSAVVNCEVIWQSHCAEIVPMPCDEKKYYLNDDCNLSLATGNSLLDYKSPNELEC